MATTLLPVLLAVLAQDAEPAKLELHIRQLPSRGRPLLLQGKTRIPPGTGVEATLWTLTETYDPARDSLALRETRMAWRGKAFLLEKPRLDLECEVSGHGFYRLALHRFGDRRVLASQDLACWTSGLIDRLDDRFEETSGVVDDSIALLRSLENAGSAAEAGALLKKVIELKRRIGKMPPADLLGQTRMLLGEAIVNLANSAPKLKWDEKRRKLVMDDYYPEAKTFSVSAHRDRAERARQVMGREFSLWILKDLRREGKRTDNTLRVLRKHGAHDSTSPYAARLEAATPGTLDGLEREIRRIPGEK